MKTGTAEEAQMLLEMPRKDANLLAMPPIIQTYMQARGKGCLGNKVFNEIAQQQKEKASESKTEKGEIRGVLIYLITYLAQSKHLIRGTFIH